MLVFHFNPKSGKFEIAGTSAGSETVRGNFRPRVDISFRERIFTARMDLPGVNPEDVTIEAGDLEVNIFGAASTVDPPGPCRLMERPFGTFMRKLSFPRRIVPDKIEAVLVDGVLTLHIPAPDLDRDPTTIEIRIDGGD